MRQRLLATVLGLGAFVLPCLPAQAQTVAELQKQINELKALIQAQQARQAPPRRGVRTAGAQNTDAGVNTAAGRPPTAVGSTPLPKPGMEHVTAHPFVLERPDTWIDALTPPPPILLADDPAHAGRPKTWFERIQIRGYTQLRGNEFIDGDRNAPSGRSRLRSVSDAAITDKNNFTFRRVRLILQGDIHERVFLYIQPDFAVNVNNQAGSEPRGNFVALRDAYADVFLDDEHRTKLRFGQQKVPYGWENLQSSQNRLTLDRSDAINSAVPGERDLGITLFYTPWHVQHIWDRLAKDGQKLFGNYGAYGLGIYNGQTLNRAERNDDLMVAGMVTWPFQLDGLGQAFAGQVLELGASGYRNRFRPEIQVISPAGMAGSTIISNVDYDDSRVGLHAILYPQPFGLQAEYNWGRGPEWDPIRRVVATGALEGGYIQAMYRVDQSVVGPFMPYVRLQTYDGGYKTSVNAPTLKSDELEVGIEFQPIRAVELTLAYARRKAREADYTRIGRAEGDLFRGQLQINY